MGKFLVFLVFAAGGFWLTSSMFEPVDDQQSGSDWYQEAQMEGCMREMRDVLQSESFATSACNCVYEEFQRRDLGLTDAFGDDFDQMSEITRTCAVRYGAQLPA